jgi:hypothetical protein
VDRHRRDVLVARVDDIADSLNRERERLDAEFKQHRERADAGRGRVRIEPARKSDRRDDFAAQIGEPQEMRRASGTRVKASILKTDRTKATGSAKAVSSALSAR